LDVEEGDCVTLAVGADGGDELGAVVGGGDGEHFDVLADDGPGTGERGVVVERDLKAAELLVVVMAVDGDVFDQPRVFRTGYY
jgi:hypothetical protein